MQQNQIRITVIAINKGDDLNAEFRGHRLDRTLPSKEYLASVSIILLKHLVLGESPVKTCFDLAIGRGIREAMDCNPDLVEMEVQVRLPYPGEALSKEIPPAVIILSRQNVIDLLSMEALDLQTREMQARNAN